MTTDSLKEVCIRMIRIAVPMIICISFVGNILNIFVLSRYKLRKHACSLYFMALSSNNLLYCSTILLISLLNDGYHIKLSNYSPTFCKLITYFGSVLSALSPSFIVLASIDRWANSSPNAERRHFSNVRKGKCLISLVIVTFSLLFLISFAMADVNPNDTLVCRIRGSSMFYRAYGIFQFVLFSVLVPMLMLLFGCLTISNVHKQRIIASRLPANCSKEFQLTRMLLLQIGAQVILFLPLCLLDLLLLFPTIYQPPPYFYSIFFICRVIFHISYATPFFLYLLTARKFRNELRKLLLNKYRRYIRHQNQNQFFVMRRTRTTKVTQTNHH